MYSMQIDLYYYLSDPIDALHLSLFQQSDHTLVELNIQTMLQVNKCLYALIVDDGFISIALAPDVSGCPARNGDQEERSYCQHLLWVAHRCHANVSSIHCF